MLLLSLIFIYVNSCQICEMWLHFLRTKRQKQTHAVGNIIAHDLSVALKGYTGVPMSILLNIQMHL